MSRTFGPSAEHLAYDRWPDILASRGMASSFFSCKNGPCPFCGGTDRYSWSKKFGGVWVCRQGCTDGKYASGFAMLMRHMGYSTFREAADDVRDFFHQNPSVVPVTREQRTALSREMTPEQAARNLARMRKFWNEAVEVTHGDPVSRYMAHRVPGMNFRPQSIRFHPALEYWMRGEEQGDPPIYVGAFPAMLALAQGVNNDMVQLHKSYLTPDGMPADVPMRKKTDLGVGVNSFAVRMMEMYGDTLGVCEGIETGWASAMVKDIPVWPCLNGPALASFEVPYDLKHQVKTLVVFADSDELKPYGTNPDGTKKLRRAGSYYADTLVGRARSQGLRTLIIRSAKTRHDMADYWSEKAAA